MPSTTNSTDKQNVSSRARSATREGVRQTKAGAILGHLMRPNGATVARLQKATGWQPHSIRATLTGLRKRGHAVLRGKNAKGVTTYCIAKGA